MLQGKFPSQAKRKTLPYGGDKKAALHASQPVEGLLHDISSKATALNLQSLVIIVSSAVGSTK